MTTIQQFDYDYKLLREAVVKGQITGQEAKDWIKTRGTLVAVMADEEKMKFILRQCTRRVNLDIPILDEGEE